MCPQSAFNEVSREISLSRP